MVSNITVVNDGCTGHRGLCSAGPNQISQEEKGS